MTPCEGCGEKVDVDLRLCDDCAEKEDMKEKVSYTKWQKEMKAKWAGLEARGLVKIEMEPDCDEYDDSDYNAEDKKALWVVFQRHMP